MDASSIERGMPFALVGVIVLGECTSLRRRTDVPPQDRGSYAVFRTLQAVAYVVAFALFVRGALPAATAIGRWAVWAGLGVTLAGTALRVWSIVTLGRWFTRVVHVSTDQAVVDRGPYRSIRHPSYTGGLLAAIGVGLSMANALAPILLGGAFALGLAYRIPVEERAMVKTLGPAYLDYMKRTKRLIPRVF